MAPILIALNHLGFRQTILLTGQHDGLADMLPNTVGALPTARARPIDCSLGSLRRHFRAQLTGRMLQSRPDLLLVHGDTTSAIAGAVAAHNLRVPLGHVEAGLRSFDLRHPWPEEGHRIAIDILSDLLFAPTPDAAANLSHDHRVKGGIYVTGNTGIDALFAVRKAMSSAPPMADRPIILVTCHRKENGGEPTARICAALKRIAASLPVRIVLPLHCNPQVRQPIIEVLGDAANIDLIAPLPYEEMVKLMARSWAIVTDSGGLQEEGAALGKPVLVLRKTTERQEALATDNLRLIGTSSDQIVAAVTSLFQNPRLYRRMSVPSLAFGDGQAAPRIANIIARWLEDRRTLTALPAVKISAKSRSDGEHMVPRELEAV
nr:UDP-N-acetylglucosamine 2-epimerase (non-hydrolyzing) [Allosphingosinicella vermicomposti]